MLLPYPETDMGTRLLLFTLVLAACASTVDKDPLAPSENASAPDVDIDGDDTGSACLDDDDDGICNEDDICAGGDDTIDTDADAVAEDCDACPDDATDDSDADGV